MDPITAQSGEIAYEIQKHFLTYLHNIFNSYYKYDFLIIKINQCRMYYVVLCKEHLRLFVRCTSNYYVFTVVNVFLLVLYVHTLCPVLSAVITMPHTELPHTAVIVRQPRRKAVIADFVFIDTYTRSKRYK